MLTATGVGLAGLDPARLFAPVADAGKIGLAISGGPDSLALLVLYAAWRDQGGAPDALVYTVDHGLRPEAVQEVEAVRRIARDHGFETRILKWKGQKPATGIPAAARAMRYRLIAEAMRADGADILITAHHLGDQAETVLMRLAHGSGVRGLGAMREFADVEGINVFRPLLGVGKQSLCAILDARGIVAAQDPTNTDPDFERARWRAMRPMLGAAGLTPERLALFARRMQRLDTLAAEAADDLWRANVELDDFGVVHIAQPVFGAPEEARLRVLSRALRQAGGGQRHDLAAIEALHARLMAGDKARSTLMGAVVAPGPRRVLVYREAGREGLPEIRADAEREIIWDGRFIIKAPAGATIGPARSLTRQAYKALTGSQPDIPIAALRAAPFVRGPDERVLALGLRRFDPAVTVGHHALT